ncbi:hypothetical protein M0R45_013125 [Rubus argutus]|uniref:Uncharacterized protein n=1 Tax=Rubus argutus TaxID=59490 RepID=A0AAW1XIX4_RUBAR
MVLFVIIAEQLAVPVRYPNFHFDGYPSIYGTSMAYGGVMADLRWKLSDQEEEDEGSVGKVVMAGLPTRLVPPQQN